MASTRIATDWPLSQFKNKKEQGVRTVTYRLPLATQIGDEGLQGLLSPKAIGCRLPALSSCHGTPPGAAEASGLQGLRRLLLCRSPLPAPGSGQQNSGRSPLSIACCSPRLGADLVVVRVHPKARHSARIQGTPFHNCSRLTLFYDSLFALAPGRGWIRPLGGQDQTLP